jgi:hypothetical protein
VRKGFWGVSHTEVCNLGCYIFEFLEYGGRFGGSTFVWRLQALVHGARDKGLRHTISKRNL